MKRLCLTFLSSAAVVASSVAVQAENVYIGARGGLLSPVQTTHDVDVDTYAITFDSEFFGGVYVGTYLGSGFRGELALDALHFDLDIAYDENDIFRPPSGGTDAIALTASLWRDLPGFGIVTPYVGFGAGLAWTDADFMLEVGGTENEFTGTDWSTLGMMGAGLRVDLGHSFALDLGYRFTSIIDARSEEIEEFSPDFGFGHYTSHQLLAGLSYGFGAPENLPSAELYSPVYLGGFLGAAWTSESHVAQDYGEQGETVFDSPQHTLGIVAGADLAPHLRGELEVSHLRSVPERTNPRSFGEPDLPYSGRFNQTFFLANLWQDFGTGRATPYVGGGLGLASVDYGISGFGSNSDSFDGSAMVFAGQFGAGVRFDASPNVTLDLGYRMKGAIGVSLSEGQPLSADNARATLYSHTLQLGASYAFGGPETMEMAPYFGDGLYVSASLGGGLRAVGELYQDTGQPVYFERPLSASIAFGQRITDMLRAEVELNLSRMNGDESRVEDPDDPLVPVDGHVDQIAIMSNYWADFDLGYVQPYIGGGLGLALVSPDFGFFDSQVPPNRSDYEDDFNPALALQLGLGARKRIADNLLIDLGYRYRSTIQAFADENTALSPGTVTYQTHAVHAGLTWEFGH